MKKEKVKNDTESAGHRKGMCMKPTWMCILN